MELVKEEYVYQILLNQLDMRRIYNQYPPGFVGLDPMEDWCDKTLGTTNWTYRFDDDEFINIFAFKTEEHRNWFVVRWS